MDLWRCSVWPVMPPKIPGVSRNQLERELARPTLTPAQRRRVRFLLLWISGAPLDVLADDMGMTERTASRWKNRFVEVDGDTLHGVQEFINDSRSAGRPARAKEKFIRAVASIPPAELTGSVRLARRIQMPERTVRLLLAGMRGQPKKTSVAS